MAGTFIDYLMRFEATVENFAAGVAAHVELTPGAGGTRVVRKLEMAEPRGMLRLLFPILCHSSSSPGCRKAWTCSKSSWRGETHRRRNVSSSR